MDRRDFLRYGTLSSALVALPRCASSRPILPGNDIRMLDGTDAMNGGADPYPIPWLDKNGSHNQSPGPGQEPSSIFHFKGRVARCNDFSGMGTDGNGQRVSFGTKSTDFSFMQGEYFAGRQPLQGTFSHIWLTLFAGPVVPENKVHDFHPPIAQGGLYWVAVVPNGSLTVSEDLRQATLEVRNLPVIDQPKWPAHDAPTTPAVMSFRVIWTASDEPAAVTDNGKQFRFTGRKASAKLEAEVEIPSTGFRWKSDAIDTSAAAFAVIGEEMNGRYFSP